MNCAPDTKQKKLKDAGRALQVLRRNKILCSPRKSPFSDFSFVILKNSEAEKNPKKSTEAGKHE